METSCPCRPVTFFNVYLKTMFIALLCFGGILATNCLAQTEPGKALRVAQGSHPLDSYAIGALELALAQLEEGYSVKVREEQITQTRGIEELRDGNLDVLWLATNLEVEEQLLPVRFPLLKGLLGYRVNIIHRAAQIRFDAIEDFDDVRKLSFGQGSGWPDVDILSSNGLKVETASKYESLFHMAEGQRFDGFPRGVIEPWVELESRSDMNLVVEDKIVLVYKLPFYLFVDQSNPELAATIHRGLNKALANGTFDSYFFNHPMVKDVLAQARLKQRLAFPLINPTLPAKTPLDRTDYWLDLEAL